MLEFFCTRPSWNLGSVDKVLGNLLHFCCCSVAKSCLTLCDPMNYSLPGSSVYGILQARILEWVAILFFTQPPELLEINIV